MILNNVMSINNVVNIGNVMSTGNVVSTGNIKSTKFSVSRLESHITYNNFISLPA